VEVQGPKGKLSVNLPRGNYLEQKGAELHALRQSDDQAALHGLARALVANAVAGRDAGFQEGSRHRRCGYRAELKGKQVNFALGYSHPIEFPNPRGEGYRLRWSRSKTHLTVSGADRGRVGHVFG